MQAPSYLAQLAKEAESQSNRRKRAALGFQEPNIPAEVHDIVDYGNTGLIAEATNYNVPIIPVPSSIRSSINQNQNQGAKWNAEDLDFETLEQMDLDQVTEAEIDSPVRESQDKRLKKEDITTKSKPKTSQTTRTQKRKVKKNIVSNEEEMDAELCPPSIFDFSSEDDADIVPALKASDVPGTFDMDFEEDQGDDDTFESSLKSARNDVFITTRNTATRKSSRQKSKTKEVSASNVPLRKGSRKRIPRSEPK